MTIELLSQLLTAAPAIKIGSGETFLPAAGVQVYLVLTGCAELSVVPVRDREASGSRRFIASFAPGELFLVCSSEATANSNFHVSADNNTSMAVGSLATFLARLTAATHRQLAMASLDRFILKLTSSLTPGRHPKTVQYFLDDSEVSVPLNAGEICSSQAGVSWFSVNKGAVDYIDQRLIITSASDFLPLTGDAWITAAEDSLLEAATSEELLVSNTLLPAVTSFLHTSLALTELLDADNKARDLERLAARKAQDATLVAQSLTQFSALFGSRGIHSGPGSTDPLQAALARVTTRMKIAFSAPEVPFSAQMSAEDQLQQAARSASIRTRRVALEDGWWNKDCGPLIGFTREDGIPIALLRDDNNQYLVYNDNDEGIPVTSAVADELRYFAYMLYRSFPDSPVSGGLLVRFGLSGIGKDMYQVAMMGLGGSLLSLAVPVVTGVVFDSVIPQSQRNQLWLLCVALTLCGLAGAAFNLTKRIALSRIECRMDQHIQGALWDRILKLPPAFFRDFSSGDLADRSLGISAIRQTLSDTVAESILAAVFSVTSLALLFYYSFELALVAIGLAIVAVTSITVLGLIQTHFQKHLAKQRGELAGKVLDLVSCIAKFKIAGAENRAFSRWAEAFFIQKQTILKARTTANIVRVFTEMFPLLASIVIFSMIPGSTSVSLSVGGFLAFFAAFTQFVSTLMSLSLSLVDVSTAIPSYKRCRPILDALPERDSGKEHPGLLKGDIEVSGVSFRYAQSAPDVINDISFRITPGEFVAVVGTSGGGKSTLSRLLLGFEKPSAGCIFYDGKDLEQLDVNQVRRQIGVVLQNGRLISGDILSNIVGSLNLTIDHAWDAARLAGLEDDIKAMPMGMHTFLSEGGGNLSGGQRQRLLIARALVNKPAILIFDEATSALDNRTQATVNESLAALRVSRIVIAHRISTIHRADRILVLDKGRLVETGSFVELMDQGGLFADLAQRQVA